MKSYRQRIAVQKRKVQQGEKENKKDTEDIQKLERMLSMYQKVIKEFSPYSDEWMICQKEMMALVQKLSEKGVEVVKINV